MIFVAELLDESGRRVVNPFRCILVADAVLDRRNGFSVMNWCDCKLGVLLLTAYYALLAGVGPGFHVLFDPHHHSHAIGQSSETPKETAPAGHSGYRHRHHHEKPRPQRTHDCCMTVKRDSENSESRVPSVRQAGQVHDHDCRLCQWYAQAQSDSHSRATEFSIASVICRSQIAASLCVKEVACLHLSRGPPAA